MLKRLCYLSAMLLAAHPATAGTIVSWQANGTVTTRSTAVAAPAPGVPIAPPLGTPFSLTLTFDPSSAFPTPFGGSVPLPGCKSVDVSGSLTVGSYTSVLAGGSKGYTQSSLPGFSPCVDGSQTQFAVHVDAAPLGSPFALPRGLLFLSYHDLLVHDAFPNSPTPAFLADVSYLGIGSPDFFPVFGGPAALTALHPPTPVPEPATLTLLGIGLLAAIRKRRQADNEMCASPRRLPLN